MRGYAAERLPVASGKVIFAGDMVIQLRRQDYWRDQLWLPLGSTFVYTEEPEPKNKPPRVLTGAELTEIAQHGHARIPTENRFLFNYTRHSHQYILPFPGTQRLPKDEFKRFRKADYPTWDRKPNGGIYSFHIKNTPVDPERWLEENATKRYYVGEGQMFFEYSTDAIAAKLMFG